VRCAEGMAEFVSTSAAEEESDRDYNCTYFVSGDQLVHQAIYCCHTCQDNSVENACCCSGCAEVCHRDHDVEYLANSLAYCDCGKCNCDLFKSTSERHQGSLIEGEHYLYGREIPLSIADRPFEISHFSSLGKEFLELALQQCADVVTHSKETFWVGCDWNSFSDSAENLSTESPSCRLQLEELALYIFNYHVQSLSSRSPVDFAFNRQLSGAEWWVQIKDLSDPDDVASSSIDLHYDKDEDIAENFDVGIFPSISTVTYLTEQTAITNSQPTIIFPTTANDPMGTEIWECYISYPVFGKHISFDGRLLHGAPANAQLRNWRGVEPPKLTDDSQPKKRITFLVNIWLNHHPANVQPLPAEIVNSVLSNSHQSTEGASLLLSSSSPTEVCSCTIPTNVDKKEGSKKAKKSRLKEIESRMEKLLLPFVSKETTMSAGESEDESEEENPMELLVEMYLPPWTDCVRAEQTDTPPDSYHLRYKSFPALIVSTEEGVDEEDELAEV
jgi:hypothetical protein